MGEFVLLVKGFVGGSRHPESVQHDGELASNGHNGPLLGGLASPLAEGETPPSEVTVFTEGAEDVVSAVDEEGAQEAVSGLGDAKLLLDAPRLPLARTKAKIGTDRAAPLEAFGILDHEGER